MTLTLALQDIWFYAFVITALLLGYVWGRLRARLTPLYEIIAGLRLERDAQARTIKHQRKAIAELERGKSEVVTYYTCPWCDMRHMADDAGFWQEHKKVHPEKFERNAK